MTVEEMSAYLNSPEGKKRFEEYYAQYMEAVRPELEALEESERITAADLALIVY